MTIIRLLKEINTPLTGAAMNRLIELENRYCARNYHPLPVVLQSGAGVWLWDVDGKRYLDMMSAYSAVSFGHSHPVLVAALTAQAQRLPPPPRARTPAR